MNISETKLSRHLARRDGELEVVATDASAEDEALDEALLTALHEIKSELNALPDVALSVGQDNDTLNWAQQAQRLSPAESGGSRLLRYPLATAATVLLASALFVAGIGIDWRGSSNQIDLASPNLVTPAPGSIPALIARSQDLENLALVSGGWTRDAELSGQSNVDTPLTRLILMQVAAIDERLSSMGTQADQERVRMLWQRRVNLLEAYNAAIENANPRFRRSM